MNKEIKINSELVEVSNVFSPENSEFKFLNLLVNKFIPDADPIFVSGYRINIQDIPKIKLEDVCKFITEKFSLSDKANISLGTNSIYSNKPPNPDEDELDEDSDSNNTLASFNRFFYNKTKPNKILKISTYLDNNKKQIEYISKYQTILLYNFTEEEYFTVIDYFQCLVNKSNSKRRESQIHLILKSNHGFYSRRFPIKKLKINLDTYYGENFIPNVHKPLIKSLSDNNSGLYLIHGHKGTGKTSYLRHLTSLIDKPFFLVTKEFVPYLADPSCLHYIITECSNSVIIIEDAEELIKPRDENYNGSATSLILNMGDGMLSDVVNCKFILTFNTDIQNIDDAITRAGRMKFQHEFKKLNPEYANKVAKDIKLNDVEYTKDTALCDIFNHLDLENLNKISKSKRNKIGF